MDGGRGEIAAGLVVEDDEGALFRVPDAADQAHDFGERGVRVEVH